MARSESMRDPIPVVLFVYARPRHLVRALASLRDNGVPLLYVFADGARSATDAAGVAEVRALVRTIDWCEVRLVERTENFGLGRNVRAGLDEVAAKHGTFIVWEDDLIAVPGAYAWICAALRHYEADERVMSVTAWTHPRVTPRGLGDSPYFDARAECWVWGTWARAWRGMEAGTAAEKMALAEARGVSRGAYGTDLPVMAEGEQRWNIWAVRWLYHHLQHGGLCLRPPWSMVEHLGFDADATNAAEGGQWANPPLRAAPPLPAVWPEPNEHGQCRALWHETTVGGWRGLWRRAKVKLGLA
jgi:hypothetical protein